MPSWNEDQRLNALYDYGILDTPYEEDFDDIVKLASKACGTPISIVNLIDKGRQWFKAEVGFGVRETPLDNSICAKAILQSDLFIIPDTTKDSRFSQNPLVTGEPNLRFYAGALLETPEGLPLGTLCVLDYKPRELDEDQLFTLKALARQVMSQLELRRALRQKTHTENTLVLERQRYQHLFASIDEGFCIIDMIYDEQSKPVDYRFIEVNPAFAKNTGLENVTGLTIKNIAPDIATSWFEIYGNVAKTGESTRFINHDLSLGDRWFDVYAFRLGDEGSTKVAILFSDISERVKLTKLLQEAKSEAEAANLAKTDFLANMSHEIRTPMNAVIGLSNILAKSQPLSAKQGEYVKTLQMSADSLLSLINDLLDIAKIEARTVELEHIPFSVVQLVQETISMMNVRAKEKGLDFQCEQQCACIEKRSVIGDPTRLRQILLNLCSNAIKFTENGGVYITISCEPMDGENKELVMLSVKDTGIGIAPHKMADIFHKFVQADSSISRKYGGTGLGLAITKTLAEIMGGTITAASEPGAGSTFTVSLPLTVATQEDLVKFRDAPAIAHAHSSTQTTRPRILLVEDYAPNVLVASTFLEEFGYICDMAENGIEAIEKIKANQYLAVLMDVQMHGMNGLVATQHIRALETKLNKKRSHIIGMTAHALAGDRERCLAAGMDDYISKPFNPDHLKQMLSQLAEAASD